MPLSQRFQGLLKRIETILSPVWGLYPHMMKPYNTSTYKGLIALKHLMAPLVAPKI